MLGGLGVILGRSWVDLGGVLGGIWVDLGVLGGDLGALFKGVLR